MAAAENRAAAPRHEIGRELGPAHERKLRMGHQQEFTVFMIQIHAQDRGDGRLVDRQFASAFLPK